MNGLDHPVSLQTWDTHLMKSLFSFLIRTGRRVKCCEKPDTKWNRAMHSQGCADTWVAGSYNDMTLHWDLPWGDEVQKHGHFVWESRLLAAVCHYVWKESWVFFLIPGMGTPFHTTVEILFQTAKVHYCPYHSSKTSTTVNQKCNSDHRFQCSPFLFSFLPILAPSILLFLVSLFLQIVSFLIILQVSSYLLQ